MEPLKILPIGGIGNVTKNMYVYEYEGAILIVDCGIGFPEPTMLGVDLLIPDITYLKDKLDKVVGMVLTHGHDDHIGGLPYILPQIGTDFPIYGSKLTIGFAQDRLEEFDINPQFIEFSPGALTLGPFQITPIQMTHSVPDTRHLVIKTPAGTAYHGSDFKFDLNPIDGKIADFQTIATMGKEGITALLCDSLNSEQEHFSTSESTLTDTFEREFRGVAGKVVITVMSSNLHRIQQAIQVAIGHNRKIALIGRSVERNVQTAVELGFMRLPQKHMLNKRRIKEFPANKVCIIIAGSQGQIGSSLARAAEGEHDFVQILPEDKVIFASEPIPGNEANVYGTIDTLSRTGATVRYPDIEKSVHVSGHSSSIEQKLLIAMLKPAHVIPIGGTYHHMIQFRELSRSLGYSDEQIHLLENGQQIAFSTNQAWIEQTIDIKNVMVDGLGIGDVGHVVLRDRQQMSGDGIVIIVVPVNGQTGQVQGDLEVISRGFVYVKENKELMDAIEATTKQSLQSHQGTVTDWQMVRKKIEDHVQTLLYENTKRQPLTLAVVMEV